MEGMFQSINIHLERVSAAALMCEMDCAIKLLGVDPYFMVLQSREHLS